MKATTHWARRRHIIQALCTLLFCLAPIPLAWIPGLEHGLIKIDFATRQVHFFGLTLLPGLLHLFSLGILFLLLCIAVMATLYGKVFCGWICPQNTIYESFETVHRYLRKHYPYYRRSTRLQKACDLSMALFAASIITLAANAYFVSASPIFVWGMSIFLMTFVTLDAHVWKHNFCKTACPYAFLQQSFNDLSSLHIAYQDRPGSPCGSCTACEKACYVDLDIKKDSFDIDCTLCGSCVDACERVYSTRSGPALLKFQFGDQSEAVPFNFLGINSWRKLFVVLAFGCFCTFFAFAIFTRPLVSMRVDYPLGGGRNSQMLPFLENGRQTNSFTLRLKNLTSTSQSFQVALDGPFKIIWEDDASLLKSVAGFEKLTLNFKLQWEEEPELVPLLTPLSFILLSAEGEELKAQDLFFKRVAP